MKKHPTSTDCNLVVNHRKTQIPAKFRTYRKNTRMKDMSYLIKDDQCVKIDAFPPSWRDDLSPTLLLFNKYETLESVLWNYMLFCGVPSMTLHKNMNLEKGWKDLPGFFYISTDSRTFYLNWIPGLPFLTLKDICAAAGQNTLSIRYVTCPEVYLSKSSSEFTKMYTRLMHGYNLLCQWLFPKHIQARPEYSFEYPLTF